MFSAMFSHILCILGLVISVLGEGEIVFLQSPSSITFQGQQKLPLSLVRDVFSAGLGFSVFESSDWRGMKINDPFSYASAVVGISVPGLSSLDTSRGHKFPLNTDSALDDTWTALDERIAERYLYAENDNDSIYLSLDEGKMPSEIHLGHLEVEPTNLSVLKYLNPEVSYDKQYIEQIALLNSVAKKVEQDGIKRDGVPDVYWIVVSGLHPLVDRYGLKSKPVFEAKQLLDASLQRLTEAFSKAYESKVIMAALASDAPHTRRYRREAKGTSSDKEKFNLAEDYSADFPVMFNIFLWFGIAYAFTLLAVTLGIADMDPGRDSIIYRMTSNRMKKDN